MRYYDYADYKMDYTDSDKVNALISVIAFQKSVQSVFNGGVICLRKRKNRKKRGRKG